MDEHQVARAHGQRHKPQRLGRLALGHAALPRHRRRRGGGVGAQLRLEAHRAVRLLRKVAAQRLEVRAGPRPQAAVVERRVLERQPQPEARVRVGAQEARVLMGRHLAADPRLLEDVHRLDEVRPLPAELVHERAHLARLRVLSKGGLVHVQGVADLVQRLGLRNEQVAGLLVHRAGLEEEAHLRSRKSMRLRACTRRTERLPCRAHRVAGAHEVVVLALCRGLRAVGLEDRRCRRRIPLLDQDIHRSQHLLALGHAREAAHDCDSIAFKGCRELARPFPAQIVVGGDGDGR